jgi:hypothetical protein
LHLRSRGLPGSLVLAGRILALGLILAGLALALLSRRLRSAGLTLPPARCRLLLSATALRGSPATALPAAGGKSPTRGAAAFGEAAAPVRGSTAASTSPSLRIHLANEAQHENARNECRPDTTP